MSKVIPSLISNNILTVTDLNISSLNTISSTFNINPSSVGNIYTSNINIYSYSSTLLYIYDNLSTASKTGSGGMYALFRLSSTYTGPTINIRRNSDNAIADFYADINGNLGTAVGATGTTFTSWFAGSGSTIAFVPIWYDQSGKGNHATQSTTTLQPSYLNTEGQPVIDFTYQSSYFNVPSGTITVNVSDLPFTFVLKHGYIGNTNNGAFFGAGIAGTNNKANVFRAAAVNSNAYDNYFWSNDYLFGSASVLQPGNVVTLKCDGTTRTAWINNSSQPSFLGAPTNLPTNIQYIAYDANGEFLNGQIYYMYLFNNMISESDRYLCEQNNLSRTVIGLNQGTTGSTPNTTTYIGDNQSIVSASYSFVSIGQNSGSGIAISEIGKQIASSGSTLIRIGSVINNGTTNILIGSIYITTNNIVGSTIVNIGMVDGKIPKTVNSSTTTYIGQIKQLQYYSTTSNYLGYISGISTQGTIIGTNTNYLGYLDQYVSGVTLNNNISNIYSTSSGVINTNIGINSGLGTNNISIGNNISGTNTLKISNSIVSCKLTSALNYLYVPNNNGFLYVINLNTNTLVTTITVGSGAESAILTPNGKFVYVGNFNISTISVVNTNTNTIVATINTNRPRSLCISPNGNYVYATNWDNNTISVINTSTNTVSTIISGISSNPNCVAVSPNNSLLYATSYNNVITIINAVTNTIITTISANIRPSGIIFNPNGLTAYVCSEAGYIYFINTSTNSLISTLNTSIATEAINISPDGSKLYIAGSQIVVISTSTNTIINTYSLAQSYLGSGISADGTALYTVNSNNNGINIYNTSTFSLISTVSLPSGIGAFGNLYSGIINSAPIMQLYDNGSSFNYVGIKAPDTSISQYTLTLPSTIATKNSQALLTLTSGITSWTNIGVNGGNTLGSSLIIGTLDTYQLNLMTNSINQVAIGTTGDISLSTAISGVRTISTTSTELDLSQSGDTYSTSTLRILNRQYYNGIIISDSTQDLTDLCFQTSTGVIQNIRLEHRSTSIIAGNVAEFQLGLTPNIILASGALVTQIPVSILNFNNQLNSKIIALYDNGSINTKSRHDFYGFGIDSTASILRYQLATNTSAASHTFYAANSTTTSTTLMSINGAGTIQIPSAGLLDLSCELHVINMITRNSTITLPTSTTSNNCVQFASWVFSNGGAILDISITVPSISFSNTKRYLIPISYNSTSGSWQKVFPISSASSNPQDFDLNININGGTCILRLIRTLGSQPGTAYITILQNGLTTDTFSNTQTITTDTAPTILFASANTGIYNSILYTQSINSANIITNSNNITCGTGNVSGNLMVVITAKVNSARFNNGTYNISVLPAPSLSTSYTLYLPPTTGSSGQALMTNGAGVTSWVSLPSASSAYYGDGSDGNLTDSAGFSITRDMYYSNLTVSNNVFMSALSPTYRIFVQNTLTINGGRFLVYGNADAGPQPGSVGAGGAGGYNSNGIAVTNSLGGSGGQGGYGYYTGGTATPPTAQEGGLRGVNIVGNATRARSLSGAFYTGGGGAGAHDGSGQYIHGGNGGGILVVCAKNIVGTSLVGTNQTFSANGTGGYNGGGGGGGGAVIIVSSTNLAQYNMAALIGVVGGPGGNQSQSASGSSGNYFIIQT